MRMVQPKANSYKKKSLFGRINRWLHLWLGLISGIVVFVVCFTAAIWVLRDEVSYFTMPFNRIEKQNAPYIPPSVLKSQAEKYLDSVMNHNPMVVKNITYRQPGKTTTFLYLDSIEDKYIGYLHLNPYSGKVVYDQVFEESNTRKFFIFIRAGHRFFWLPQHIGSPLVGSCCIIFLITLVTGLIWWYPPKWTKATRQKSFTIKWNARWKRLNIDLHNVLGFYALLFVFILTYTGVYYSFQWFREGYQYVLGVDKEKMSNEIESAQAKPNGEQMDILAPPLDELWRKVYEGETSGEVTIGLPADNISPISVAYNPVPGKYHKRYTQYFDQKDLELIDAKGLRNMKFDELDLGEKIIRMNFDLHTATIGGLPTKILACIASLIGASLPVTGFIIWYNRKWGKKRRKKLANHRTKTNNYQYRALSS